MKIIVFKFAFGFLGLRFGQFLGANPLGGLVTGIIIGHVLDHIATMRFMQWRYGKQQQAHAKALFQSEFVGTLFFMFGKLCGADGGVSKVEVMEVERIISEVLKLSRRDRAKAIEAFKSARTSTATFQSMAVRYLEIYQAHPQMLETTIQMFLKLAIVDEVLNEHEERLIHAAATVFGIDETRYQNLKRPYGGSNGSTNGTHSVPTGIDKCYAVLGCQPSDSDTDIKKNYRKLVAEFHPDKIYSKDLPQEFIEFANQKMKDIQHAYETVKAERGFN